MKRLIYILTILMLSISFINFVYASNSSNKLYFTNNGKRLYYDTKLFDSDIFMHHTDMIPGSSYEDRLLIENHSNTDYDLYFKIKEISQNEYANEILDNIWMEIYLEDNLIYQGKVKGLDYSNNGVNLQDVIYVGKYLKGFEKEIIVKTTFDENYSNPNNNELSHIEWEFYAVYDDNVDIINPDTGDSIEFYWPILLIIILLTISIVSFLKVKSY